MFDLFFLLIIAYLYSTITLFNSFMKELNLILDRILSKKAKILVLKNIIIKYLLS